LVNRQIRDEAMQELPLHSQVEADHMHVNQSNQTCDVDVFNLLPQLEKLCIKALMSLDRSSSGMMLYFLPKSFRMLVKRGLQPLDSAEFKRLRIFCRLSTCSSVLAAGQIQADLSPLKSSGCELDVLEVSLGRRLCLQEASHWEHHVRRGIMSKLERLMGLLRVRTASICEEEMQD
jgi:hypothetical protein